MPLTLKSPNLSLPAFRGRRRGGGVVGLDIQPGYVTAVQAHVNGGIVVQHAAGLPLPPDAIREGEVLDERTLADALRELFADGRLGKRVRIGLANQRTVLRTLELPPVNDRKELAAAVRFQAEDQVPMPLAGAVLDFHSLGVIDTPNGPRQRVIVVAAQREMVERLLRAVRDAGLRPEGVDLSAFALIRSLYRPPVGASATESERVLYLNVGGLTNMAIADGSVCRFTRVVGGGLEAMAVEVAERRGIPLVDARALLAAVDLTAVEHTPLVVDSAPPAFDSAPPAVDPASLEAAPAPTEPPPAVTPPEGEPPEAALPADALPHDALPHAADREPAAEDEPFAEDDDAAADVDFHAGFGDPPAAAAIETWALAQDPSGAQPRASEPDPSAPARTSEELAPAADAGAARPAAPARPRAKPADADVRAVLENGIREIVGELRNSLDFHRAQDGGGEVARVILSGAALELPGFADALQADLGMTVVRQDVSVAGAGLANGVSAHRLAIATGLATEEAPR